MGRKALFIRALRPINVVLVVLVAALAAGGSESARGSDLTAAQAYHGYPVYWAGEEVAGLPLEEIAGTAGPVKKSGWTSFYGSCELSGTDHPSCAPPLEIQVMSTCRRWASSLGRNKELFGFRGAKAFWFPGMKVRGAPGLSEVGPFEVFTGRVTIVIWPEGESGAEDRKLAFAAADALRTVNQTQPSRLPPPTPGSLTGKLACQTKPG